jgi:hypothetical protein
LDPLSARVTILTKACFSFFLIHRLQAAAFGPFHPVPAYPHTFVLSPWAQRIRLNREPHSPQYLSLKRAYLLLCLLRVLSVNAFSLRLRSISCCALSKVSFDINRWMAVFHIILLDVPLVMNALMGQEVHRYCFLQKRIPAYFSFWSIFLITDSCHSPRLLPSKEIPSLQGLSAIYIATLALPGIPSNTPPDNFRFLFIFHQLSIFILVLAMKLFMINPYLACWKPADNPPRLFSEIDTDSSCASELKMVSKLRFGIQGIIVFLLEIYRLCLLFKQPQHI